MICPKCDGRGKTTEYDGLRKFWCDYKCEVCNGTGEVMTEQEWLQTCDAEQLADFIADVCYELLDDVWSNDGDTSCDYRETEKNYWVEWLKQPHSEVGK